jgi:hypothetical protein
MIVLLTDLRSPRQAVFEIRAIPSARRMREAILREVDHIVSPDWRRTVMCNVFLCQQVDSLRFFKSVMPDGWEERRKGAYVQAYLVQKTSWQLAADERRLAIAMAFLPRLGSESFLGLLDAELILDQLLWLCFLQ